MFSRIAGAIFAMLSMIGSPRASAQELIIIPIIPKPQAESLFSESFGKLIRDVAKQEDIILRKIISFALNTASRGSCDDINTAAAQIRADLARAGRRVYASSAANLSMRLEIAYGLAAYRIVLERLREDAESTKCVKT